MIQYRLMPDNSLRISEDNNRAIITTINVLAARLYKGDESVIGHIKVYGKLWLRRQNSGKIFKNYCESENENGQ